MAIMRKIIFLICVFAGLIPCSGEIKDIWQLGHKDGSCQEFALAPDGKSEFVSSGFGQDSHFFLPGTMSPEEFPYILPGPSAEWAGGTYWSGYAMLRLPFYMQLASVNPDRDYVLEIALTDAEVESGMFLRVEINGKPMDEKITPGTKELVYTIPGRLLGKRINKLVLQLFNGKSLTFDAITLRGPEETALVPMGDEPLIFLSMSEYEDLQNSKRIQPLLLEVIAQEDTEIRVETGKQVYEKKLDSGRNILEIPLPAVPEKTFSKVDVFADGKRILSESVERAPKPLITPADYVNQFAGSSGSRWMIGPGPWMPFGMVKIMPDNEDFHWKSGYEYHIENIMGFSHLHEWTMAGLLMMPTTGTLQLQPGTEKEPDLGYRSRMDKKTEVAKVGYYAVDLTDYRIKAELTATTRASLQRYTFHEAEGARILVDFFFPAEYAWTLKDLYVRKVSDTEIEGWTWNNCHSTGYHGIQDYKLHFVMQFDKPFETMNGWIQDGIYPDLKELKKDMNPAGNPWTISHEKTEVGDAGLFLNFKLDSGDAVQVRTGISLVSIENARLNLSEEMAAPFGWDFEQVVENQRTAWNDLFGRVRIETDEYLQKEKFYTNLYRAISPRTAWNDLNGEWVDMNGEVARIDKPGKSVYGGDALWGTHWTLNPFYNLLYPEFMSDWVYTFEQFSQRGGWLPNGNPGMKYFRVMVGSPAVPMIVSAYQHGIRDFDAEAMYRAILHQQTAQMENYPSGGQVGNESYPDYITLGYVPIYPDLWDWNSPHYQSYVSNTLEYAYQDYCAAQYFRSLGKPEYGTFMKRSGNWKTIFDASTGFVRPRYADGRWLENFDPYHAPGFCEGSAWQFTWYVPHDLRSLVDTIGEERFINRLEKGMEESERVNFNALGDRMELYPINHGNETNMQSCYLFNYTSEPWRTQKWARAIQEQYYGIGPRDAYPGDEDQGQMSSWYVMSSIGLFQMTGGCEEDPLWTLGSPRFRRVEIRLNTHYYPGKTLVIEAENASHKNCYIQSVSLNGKRIRTPFIPWSKLKAGGILRLKMGDTPAASCFR